MSKLKNIKKNKGFTIVELLVVIVVIGILAAITIVSYTGVTARAKGTKAQSNAVSAQKVAETMNAEFGVYPNTIARFTAGQHPTTATLAAAKIPSGMTIITETTFTAGNSGLTATTANDGTTVMYACLTSCTNSTGGRISWWNYGAATPAVEFIYVGAATSAGPFVTVPAS